jgi:hypothetical protein
MDCILKVITTEVALAVGGVLCCLAIFAAILLEYYYPVKPEYPKIFR